MCTFTVAVNRRTEGADYFRVTAWDKRGEVCKKYLLKGRKVCVVGPVSVHTYQTQSGETRASLEVTAEDVEFVGGKESGYTQVEVEDNPFA